LARRVLQFPVRNAFAPRRSHDSLARDTEDHTHRIAEQVQNEIVRQAERQATGRSAEFEKARNRDIVVLRPLSRFARLRRQIAWVGIKARSYATSLFKRR
jgi:hypothetical protein